MSEDLTKKLPKRDSEKLDLIVTAVQALISKTTSLEGAVALMQLRLDAIDSRLDRIDSRLDAIDSRLDGIDLRVDALDKKVEERLYDTRPIWEQVVANVTQLLEGQQRFEQSQQRLEQEFGEMKESQRRLEQSQQRLEQKIGEIKLNVTSLQEGQLQLDQKLERSGNGSREIKTFLRDILRRMSIFNDTLLAIQADYRDIYDRVRHLELRNSEL